MSPKRVCQQSFFTFPRNPRGAIQLLAARLELFPRPALQHLVAECTHLLDHALFRLIGFAQVARAVLAKVK